MTEESTKATSQGQQSKAVATTEPQKGQLIEGETTADPKKSKAAGQSTQTQLLTLAKFFCLDGALRPPQQQAPIDDRSERRERFNHNRRQQNIEKVIEKSLHYCSDSAISDKADPDWFDQFIEFAERVSNPTMQDLWAKILAGELTHPGTFSLKTLKAFKNLSLSDARLFGKVCSLGLKDNSKKNIRVISGVYQKPSLFNMLSKNREASISLNKFGLSYSEILTLADHHLLFSQETELPPLEKGEELALKYNGIPLIFKAKKADTVIKFYKLTPIGAELAQLIGDKPDDGFLSHMKSKLSHHLSC